MAPGISIETDYPHSVPSGRMIQPQGLLQSLWKSVHVNMSAVANPETMRVKTPNILLYNMGFIVMFLEEGSTTFDVGVQYRVWWKSGTYFSKMYAKRENERRTGTIFPLHAHCFHFVQNIWNSILSNLTIVFIG
jgi:hypothetical protein